jgi:hypothetical protein
MSMKTPILIAAAAAALIAAGAHAGPRSTPSELRGYQACVDANADHYRGLRFERTYLINQTDTGRTYYLNATAWENGERVGLGFRCETNRTGRLIEASNPSYVQYVPAADSVQVASQ